VPVPSTGLGLPTKVPLEEDADLSVPDEAKVLAAPDDPSLWPRWRERLHAWRRQTRARLNYSDARYAGMVSPPFIVGMAAL
jgi:formylglycine-generating enzyme